MKVALVHDWLIGMRGGEKVLEVLCELYPNAPIYTLFFDSKGLSPTILKHKIVPSNLNKLPYVLKYYRMLLPLYPSAIESFNLTDYDLVISTSHCVAKGVITAGDSTHISYTHTPMRYIWDMYHHYFESYGKIKKLLMNKFIHYLRIWDVTASSRVDHFIANSDFVRKRVKKFYRRDCDVIHPPVELDRFSQEPCKGRYYLFLSALVPYKRVDLIIEAFKDKFANKELIIAGSGPLLNEVKKEASQNIQVIEAPSDAKVVELLKNCKAFLYPGVEDFGIVPLEAMACGKPVIAYGRGGALETIVENVTGIFFGQQSVHSLIDAIAKFEKTEDYFDAKVIRKHAESFSKANFKEQIKTKIETLINENG